jgi:subtilase family serine protease
VTDPQGASDIETFAIKIRKARDFIVTDIKFENIGTGASKRVKITATVKNDGYVWAHGSKAAFLLDNRTVLGNVTHHWLKVKESVDISLTWDARSLPGNHSLRVWADKPNTVPETYENNNTRTETFRIVNGHVQP